MTQVAEQIIEKNDVEATPISTEAVPTELSDDDLTCIRLMLL